MFLFDVWRLSLRKYFLLAFLALPSFLSLTAWLSAAQSGEELYRVKAEFDIKVPMRDGVLLSTDIYRPDTAGKFPVLLERTPYNNFDPATGYYFAQRGYAVVLQDVRGKYDSDGEFYPLVNEARDGYDTQEWCSSQPWSNGKVGTMGGSYVGATQWLPAILANEHLVCMFPTVAGSNYYLHWKYDGGVFALSFNTMWGIVSVASRVGQDMAAQPIDWNSLLSVLPLRELPSLLGRNAPWFRDWLAHPIYDDYWKKNRISGNYERIKVPAFNLGGWYDVFIHGTTENFSGMRERGGSQVAREGQRLLVGPWFHTSPSRTKLGQVEFGAQAAVNETELQLKWFDYWLKEKQNGLDREAPVKLFVMGENRWRDFDSWPPRAIKTEEFFFHSRRGANGLEGDGFLDRTAPAKNERVDTYTYDPADPVPTLGGNDCCRETIVTQGPYDQRPVERRDDVMVYTSRALSESLTVIGPVVVKLWAASSAVNTDFTAKLVDVYPDGQAINLSSGILRAPFKDGFDHWSELTPEQPYEFTISLTPTANVFLPGHRIRVDISSSDFPRFARNLNTPGPEIADKTEMVTARQQVFHDKIRQSRILLPVLE